MTRRLNIDKRVIKAVERYPLKHQRQITDRILALTNDPLPHDSKALLNYDLLFRCNVGEYRIIYAFDDDVVNIILIGKRNDNSVYRDFKRLPRA